MNTVMFLEIYLIWGIAWGLLCLLVAKENNKNPQLWFTLGVLFNVITFIMLMNLPVDNDFQENKSICSFCKHKVGRKDRYCSECGELLKGLQTENFTNNFCIHCGKGIKKEYKFCPNCGRLLIPLKSFQPKVINNITQIPDLSELPPDSLHLKF